jgi:hypothetical protein
MGCDPGRRGRTRDRSQGRPEVCIRGREGYLAVRSRGRGAAPRRLLDRAAACPARTEIPDRMGPHDQPDRPRAAIGGLRTTAIRAAALVPGPGRTCEASRPRRTRRPVQVAGWANRARRHGGGRRRGPPQSGAAAGIPDPNRPDEAGTPDRTHPHGAGTPGQGRPRAAGTPGQGRPRAAGTPDRNRLGEVGQRAWVGWRSRGTPAHREAAAADCPGWGPSRDASRAGKRAAALPLVPGAPGIRRVPARFPAARNLPVLPRTPARGHRGECRAGLPANTPSSGSAPGLVPGEGVRQHLARAARPRPRARRLRPARGRAHRNPQPGGPPGSGTSPRAQSAEMAGSCRA